MNSVAEPAVIDAVDRTIIVATQKGLPLVAHPYHAVAEQVGVPAEEVMSRMQRMLDHGIIRRIAAVPNHYALGYKANGMTVWDVADARIDELGRQRGRTGMCQSLLPPSASLAGLVVQSVCHGTWA